MRRYQKSNGKGIQIIKGSAQRVGIFKLIFICMHHLIKSMRKCLRKAISNDDGGPIYYLLFCASILLNACFCIKRLFIFSFILQLAVILSFE